VTNRLKIMKMNKNIVLAGICLMIAMASCKKYETFPVDKVTLQYVFNPLDSAGTNAQKYLLGVYQVLKNGHNRVGGDYLDAASDDAISSAVGSGVQVTELSTAGYTSFDIPNDENVWEETNVTNTDNYWAGIRTATEFIDNIGVVPVKGALPNGVGERWVWQSEARFLRAYFYFELVKRFGGVPLLGNTVYNINDNLALPRASFSNCITYIVNELNAIQDSLITAPLMNPSQDNYRVTQGAAMALKARVLLYAASPLFNGGNIDPSNPLTGYTSFDGTRWTAAATAAQAVMNLNAYSLDPNFKNIFLTQNDPEVIMIRQYDAGSGGGESVDQANGPVGYPEASASGRTSPTQDLVNAYPMSNGLAITDPTSGYDPTNPYSNRDPRLTYTILYNGAQWLNTQLQTYEGGQSKPNINQQQTRTGYYLRKFLGNFENTNTYSNQDEDWVMFRYAEILLDYAEAENESEGPNTSVYAQLTALRARAGIAPGANNLYGLAAAMSQAAMRTAIQNERRIEMAFEEQRYFDIKRWEIAAAVMNTPRQGVTIINSAGSLTYNYGPVLNTKFNAPAMYLYPIPYDEVLKNPNMKQNPGW
jgi:hypothetical protein